MRSTAIDNFICLGTFPCMWLDCKPSYNFKAANAIIESWNWVTSGTHSGTLLGDC